MHILSIAFSLFLIMNALGVAPVVLSILKEHDEKTQRKILIREMVIALLIIFAFNFLGERFFTWLNISEASIRMAGGMVLFLISIRMIFGSSKSIASMQENSSALIVPIATPLIAGPSLLAAILIYAHEVSSLCVMLYAILIAWAASAVLLLLAPRLKKWVGNRGLNACERLMGLILILIAVQMFLQGLEELLPAITIQTAVHSLIGGLLL